MLDFQTLLQFSYTHIFSYYFRTASCYVNTSKLNSSRARSQALELSGLPLAKGRPVPAPALSNHLQTHLGSQHSLGSFPSDRSDVTPYPTAQGNLEEMWPFHGSCHLCPGTSYSPFLMLSGNFIITVYFQCMVRFRTETIPLVDFAQICPALLKLIEASSN